MGKTDLKILDGLTQKYEKKRTGSKNWMDWLKKRNN